VIHGSTGSIRAVEVDGEAPRLYHRRLTAAATALNRAELRAAVAEAAAVENDHLRERNATLRRALWRARQPSWGGRLGWFAAGLAVGLAALGAGYLAGGAL
jgi:anti-sigma factor RsiW